MYAIEQHDGRPFIVMELIKGSTLAERMGRQRVEIHLFSGATHVSGVKILSPWFYSTDGFREARRQSNLRVGSPLPPRDH